MSERNCYKCIHHTSGNCDSWNCKMQTVEDVKKEAVNEYVKAVVKELKIDSSIKLYGSGNSDNYLIPVKRAIEIVKHGCVSDDVCEWESDYGFISDKYKRETGCGYTFYDLHHAVPFKYCPYCGNKIKIVGD